VKHSAARERADDCDPSGLVAVDTPDHQRLVPAGRIAELVGDDAPMVDGAAEQEAVAQDAVAQDAVAQAGPGTSGRTSTRSGERDDQADRDRDR
jgi:hypothetical protein